MFWKVFGLSLGMWEYYIFNMTVYTFCALFISRCACVYVDKRQSAITYQAHSQI